MICKRYVWDEGFHFIFTSPVNRGNEALREVTRRRRHLGKHEKKKSKKDKKKSKEKDSSDEVSKHCIGHLQDFFFSQWFH